MARLGRCFLPGQPVHLIQRGNNRQPIFFAPEDYQRYHGWLADAGAENGCAVYAYVLMTNHVHLLAAPEREDSIPRALQSLGRRYVRYVNDTYRRTGTLWEGRYRAALIDSENYFLSCCRYIELNPVRAGMVRHPSRYRWSSYAAHARGTADRLVARHALYRRLGRSDVERRAAYRGLFRDALDAGFLDALRKATNGSWELGDERFKRKIAETLGRRVSPLPHGRPRKPNTEKSEI